MIDIHNHLIPNIDDGSDSLELSRRLLKAAASEGITEVCITPHFMKHGPFNVRKKELLELFESFKEETKDINIKLYLGNELYIDPELDELLLNDEICTMNESRYVLVEFPFEEYKREYDEYLYNISLEYQIIIAHPERYRYVKKDHDFVKRWLNEGYLLQSNTTSMNSSDSRRVIYDLLSKGRLSLMASDAHNEYRPLSMIEAYDHIARKFNEEVAEYLMNVNPKCVIENEPVKKIKPVKKHFF